MNIQTDLFRPHNDPDDHWDLACVYALARAGDIELKGIVVDYPPPHHRGDPDVLALAQMNYLTGLHVPFSIGSPLSILSSNDRQKKSLRDERPAVRMIAETLEHASSPVVIHIVGSCRDVARAGSIFPDFAYALGKVQEPNWLDYLHRESDHALLAKQAQVRRNMWCTASFFHAAGKSIAADGKILPRDQTGAEQVFTFDPIEMQCDANGMTKWSRPPRQLKGMFCMC